MRETRGVCVHCERTTPTSESAPPARIQAFYRYPSFDLKRWLGQSGDDDETNGEKGHVVGWVDNTAHELEE